MQVSVHAKGKDVDDQIAYCKRLGLANICLFARAMPGFDQKGYPDPTELRGVLGRFSEEGIQVRVMAIGRPTPAAILEKPEAAEETEQLLKTIAVIGESGVRSAMIYHRAPIQQDGLDEESYWRHIVSHWRTIVDQGQRSDVRIAAHSYYQPKTMMVWNVETNLRLIEAVPSPYNGVTFCTKLYMSDDDVYSAVEKFRDRIFFAHTRDLVRTADPDYWVKYDEVQLGEGDMDFPRLIDLLHKAGYDGTIAPEHLGDPRTPGEEPEPIAVAYLQKHLQ